MNKTKKPAPQKPRPISESTDFGEATMTRQISNNNTTTVSQRVPITPAPARPPDRNNK